MIGKLTGRVDFIAEDHCILDVGGVGYLVFCSSRILSQLHMGDKQTVFWIETYMREDVLRLYGFVRQEEKKWFTLLQNVQGVGAKVALALLGVFTPEELTHLIYTQDITALCRAPGIGKKVAQRLVTELKTVGAQWHNVFPVVEDKLSNDQTIQDALSALQNLGYSREQAGKAIKDVSHHVEQEFDSAKLIRLALKALA